MEEGRKERKRNKQTNKDRKTRIVRLMNTEYRANNARLTSKPVNTHLRAGQLVQQVGLQFLHLSFVGHHTFQQLHPLGLQLLYTSSHSHHQPHPHAVPSLARPIQLQIRYSSFIYAAPLQHRGKSESGSIFFGVINPRERKRPPKYQLTRPTDGLVYLDKFAVTAQQTTLIGLHQNFARRSFVGSSLMTGTQYNKHEYCVL